MNKYNYWVSKIEQYTEAMHNTSNDMNKYIENFNQCLNCEFEKNKYYIISRKEFILLFTLLKYHNSINIKNKLYMNQHGIKAKLSDRNRVRDSTIESIKGLK